MGQLALLVKLCTFFELGDALSLGNLNAVVFNTYRTPNPPKILFFGSSQSDRFRAKVYTKILGFTRHIIFSKNFTV